MWYNSGLFQFMAGFDMAAFGVVCLIYAWRKH